MKCVEERSWCVPEWRIDRVIFFRYSRLIMPDMAREQGTSPEFETLICLFWVGRWMLAFDVFHF